MRGITRFFVFYRRKQCRQLARWRMLLAFLCRLTSRVMPSQSSMWRRTRPAGRSVELALIGFTSASSKKIENLLGAVNLCFAHHTNR